VSLAEEVRSELAAISPTRPCDVLAELSALFHTAGSMHLRRHREVSFHLDLATSSVARRGFALLRRLDVVSEIRTYRRPAFDRATRYQLHVGGDADTLAVLRRAGVVGRGGAPLAYPPARVVGRHCCRAAYVRGALLGSGTVSGPRAPNLEVRFSTTAGAEFLARVALAEEIALRVRERSQYAAATARGTEDIADVLALAGASDAALALDEHAVVGAARAAANRLANADHANLVRTARAARGHIAAIRALEEQGVLDALPEEFRQLADLRRRHPGYSLRELGARCDPPAGKSAVQRRLARLVALAEE
jgi:DNA-binding protein WhiA